MKKTIIIILMLLCISIANAQEGKYYGSKQGGFALTFGADPVINFIGNMFNGTTNQEFEGFKGLGSDLFDGATISGKYMVANNQAVTLSFGFNNHVDKSHQYDNGMDHDETNLHTDATHKFMVLAGYQYLLRPGKRLQPVLGINLAYAYNKKYSRDEHLDMEEYQGAPSNTFGLLANVGVEYFICSNISLSGTIDFGVCKTWTNNKRSSETNPSYNVKRYSSYELKTGQFGGNLAVSFYF